MFLLNESYLPSSFVDCFLCCFAVADLKRKLQALRNNLAEKSQQARASTLVPPPGLPVPRVLPGQEPAPCPKAMQLGNNTPSAAGKAITAFADGSLNPGLTLSPPQAPLVHPKVSVDASKACEHTLKGSTHIPCAPALTASPFVSPAISLAPYSSSTGNKRALPCPAAVPLVSWLLPLVVDTAAAPQLIMRLPLLLLCPLVLPVQL